MWIVEGPCSIFSSWLPLYDNTVQQFCLQEFFFFEKLPTFPFPRPNLKRNLMVHPVAVKSC